MKTDGLHYCQRCNRRLKSVKAIQDGMGNVCKQKSIQEQLVAQQEKESPK